jgi:tetraacyldisaccharide 4'-kinase
MPRAPAFWQHDGWLPRLLSPAAAIVAGVTARRVSRVGWRAPVPVICCGNVTVGGAGKTTLALDLVQRLRTRGAAVHVLLRGYGGSVRDVHRVGPGDPVSLVGDEALLLAQYAPTWVGGDRAASARAAVADGAGILVLDDGLQNPTLVKDLSLLVIDGITGFGNGRVLPAGPLREPVPAGAARCQAAVLIGPDRAGAVGMLPAGFAVWRASLVQGPELLALHGRRVLAFAGIGRPDKFFSPLAEAGVSLVGCMPFPDHHAYAESEFMSLVDQADRSAALLVTTPKDAVRLSPQQRAQVQVVGVSLAWDDPGLIELALGRLLSAPWPAGRSGASP